MTIDPTMDLFLNFVLYLLFFLLRHTMLVLLFKKRILYIYTIYYDV